ncbi:MAG: DNA polymerase [Planctomycetota bacterium]|nr:DNA polymerase [Planctomycetota bacterium]
MLPKLVVVDGHAILFRSFFAIRELTSPDGEPTNAIFGFLRSINKVTERLEPQYIVVCFDSPGKTFREEDYAQYKAQREPAPEELKQQIQPVHELLEAMNIPVIEKEGFEADDLIGTIVAYCEENEIETIIVSRDKDLYQLLSDNVRMFDDKNEEFFTAQDLKEKFGLEPRQVPDWLGLMGDSSDNIPGVPKVGKKTARDLLQEYDNVEGILENIEKIREKRKAVGKSLEEHQDEARRSKKLAMLQAETGVDFDPQSFRRSEPDYTRLAKLYRKFGFNSMLKDIEDKLPSSKAETEWRVIDTADELESYVNRCLQMDEVAIDTETTGLSYFSDKLIGISLSAEEGKGVYIPCVEGYGDSLLSARPADGLPTAKIRELLSPLAESDKVIKVGHNLKFDMCFLRRSGIELKPPFGDSLVAAWLLTPEGSSLKLDDVARQYLGLSTVPITDLIGEGKNKASMDEVDLEELAHYAAEDADIALRLHRILVKKLREEDLYEPYSEIELPLLPVLAEMECNGIALNTDRLERLGEKLQTELSELTSKIHEAAGEKFNINSPIQLAQILFDKLGLTVVKEGKSRPSTDASSLEAIKDEHEIVPSCFDTGS